MGYTWFNRLAAIRYMELHDYLDHGFRVLSNPTNPDSLPEIIDHASDVVDTLDPDQKYLDKNHIIELQLAGNKEEELYRELLLGQCHRLFNIMPFMFEAIDDATELLLPDNLTKTDSILKGLVNEIPEEDWSEIEVIGWLYQFYISEHKDAVIGKVVKSEDIPAATQLFTPNWIVKYLVQNSLGRQWLATYPESELKGKMEYYIEPAEQSDDVIEQLKAITPTSIDPEQIKVLDPAAGSGHILVEVYEVLREIYLERGYRLREIPELILTKNIYSLDIDDRAAQLAGFALMMKAREDDRRIFQRVEDGEVALNVYSLQSTEGLDVGKLWQALNLEGNQKQGSTGGLFDGLDDEADGFVQPTGIYKEYFELLQTLKSTFLQAKTLGSLIQVDNDHLQNLVALKELLQTKEKGSDPSAKRVANVLLPIANQAIALAQKYGVVVANPPYMGSKGGMNSDLKTHVNANFKFAKQDLYSAFIERGLNLLNKFGYQGFVTMESWMFLNSFEDFRAGILENTTIESLGHFPYQGKSPTVMGINFGISAFVLRKVVLTNYSSYFYCSRYFELNQDGVPLVFPTLNERTNNAIQSSFRKIPGDPISYWIPEKVRDLFVDNAPISNDWLFRQGMATSDNERFLRYWQEVDNRKLDINCESLIDLSESSAKWFPYLKGGEYRKWYGNHDYIVNWEHDGKEMKDFTSTLPQGTHVRLKSKEYYCLPNITYSSLSSGSFGCRVTPTGFLFDTKGSCLFSEEDPYNTAGFLNSKVSQSFLDILCPTMDYSMVGVKKLPIGFDSNVSENTKLLVQLAQKDWDSSEASWNFDKLGFAEQTSVSGFSKIKGAYQNYLNSKQKDLQNTLELEVDNNIRVAAYFGISDSFELIVNQKDITCAEFSDISLLLTDCHDSYYSQLSTRLVSYSLGCMMGRYSLDRQGLLYAHSDNEGFKELVTEGAYQTFPADDDGIVPLASEEWLFEDDATARFCEFVKTVWGDEHLQENLEFVAESLCLHALKLVKGESANDTVRRYFSKQFYKDHCRTYKKRPIYWLFSSGKEKAFECLVYLHRYNEGTLSRMRTEYVTPLMGKYEAQHSLLAEQKIEATTTEARRIEKELKSLDKKQAELRTFDEQLKHYAEMRITLDLDDGVKANYGKFGNLLADVKTIHGKAVK